MTLETDIAALLDELSAVQSELLTVLQRKRQCLLDQNAAGLADIAADETQILLRLQACHDRRGELLADAASEGRPADNLRALAGTLPRMQRRAVETQIRDAESRSRLLQHHSLTNWVVTQRTLLHLSQLLEIIATGGRIKPTYGGGESSSPGGSMLDHAA